MNDVLELLHKRRSVRSYNEEPIPDDVRSEILSATMRAPTAGNMMLYSIIEIEDQGAKETLARTCDNQPFIARAPLVLLFLADYQRTVDYLTFARVPERCAEREEEMRTPQEGDLLLACWDALVAAQTAVIAAESLGVGSCYIGDILENYEKHKDLFDLPQYVLPICLLCFGYPKEEKNPRPLTSRFNREYVVFRDRYRRLSAAEFEDMYSERQGRAAEHWSGPGPVPSVAELLYARKFGADFMREMNRSVRVMLQAWRKMETGGGV